MPNSEAWLALCALIKGHSICVAPHPHVQLGAEQALKMAVLGWVAAV